MWLLLAPAQAATLAQIEAAIDACANGPVHPLPALSDKQRAELVDGQIVRILHKAEDPSEPSAAVGIGILKGPRDALWVACQDPHTVVDESLTEFVVHDYGADHQLWYGYFDLPRPLQDRQWVVDSTNNHAMARATGDACWEHVWKLVPDGLDRIRDTVATTEPKGITLDHLERAIFTPTNEGSWFMAPVADGEVLVVYTASSVVGGAIPDWVMNSLAMSRLEGVLRRLEERAHAWAPGHYGASHAPLYGGDGAPVAPLVP
jgi:hypothetical protein